MKGTVKYKIKIAIHMLLMVYNVSPQDIYLSYSQSYFYHFKPFVSTYGWIPYTAYVLFPTEAAAQKNQTRIQPCYKVLVYTARLANKQTNKQDSNNIGIWVFLIRLVAKECKHFPSLRLIVTSSGWPEKLACNKTRTKHQCKKYCIILPASCDPGSTQV